jgi:nitrilase
MAMRVVKAAAVQLSPVLYSREGTVDKIVRTIDELGQQGVQFATFPETVVPYYPYFSFLQPAYQIVGGREHLKLLDQAVTVPSPSTHAISDACKQAGVVASIGVNERDGETMYNTQLLFDADGTLIQRRRKISPTYHERMVWGQGDGSGLRAVDSAIGRIGQLACWEHYNPLARYAMMADGEQIHSAMYPGSIFGDLFSEQTQVSGSMLWSLRASSSARPPGWIRNSRRRSSRTPAARSGQSRAAASRSSLPLTVPCCVSQFAPAKASRSPTLISHGSTSASR